MNVSAATSTQTRPPALDRAADLRIPVALAKFPFFALTSGQPGLDYECQQAGKSRRLTLRADPDLGMATLADCEFILWATSVYTKALNEGRQLPDVLTFRSAEVLHFLGRGVGGRQHKLLADAIGRLAKTQILTNIAGAEGLNICNWIERCEPPATTGGSWQVWLAPWIRRQVEERQLIKIGPELLQLRGLRRRVYLWGKAHAGGKRGYERYELAFADAHRKSGSRDKVAKFCYELRGLVRENNIPGFVLSVERKDRYDTLIIDYAGAELADAETKRADTWAVPLRHPSSPVIELPELRFYVPDEPILDTPAPAVELCFPPPD